MPAPTTSPTLIKPVQIPDSFIVLPPTYEWRIEDRVLYLTSTVEDAQLLLRTTPAGDTLVRESALRRDQVFPGVDKVVYRGGRGDDVLNASSLSIPLDAFGGWGRDELTGGHSHDRLNGEQGHDHLSGHEGDDTLIGGIGTDELSGGEGDDWLVAIDNNTADIAYTGGLNQHDSVWVDKQVGGPATDTVRWARAGTTVHEVESFVAGDKTLDGDDIWDPQLANGVGAAPAYVSHGDEPLWPSDMRPSGQDVVQGALGDCKVVAGISAVAHSNPGGSGLAIRRAMTDFGDGTFGVALGDDYYRVDGDLVEDGGSLLYAGTGRDGALWAAIAEKAIAWHDSRANRFRGTYEQLKRTGSLEVFTAFGSSEVGNPFTNRYARSAADLGTKLFRQWNAYEPMTLSLMGSLNSVGGSHAYTVWNVVANPANPAQTRVVLRNPWGRDGNANPGIPGNADANPNDALVTYTAQQIWNDNRNISRVNWGRATS